MFYKKYNFRIIKIIFVITVTKTNYLIINLKKL